jgi:hypothetical protein
LVAEHEDFGILGRTVHLVGEDRFSDAANEAVEE